MLQAWIVSARGSLYFAAEATPYNLENLRAHIRSMQRGGEGLRLSLNLGGADDGPLVPEVAAFVHRLVADGVRVSFSTAVEMSDGQQRRAVEPDDTGLRPLAASSFCRKQPVEELSLARRRSASSGSPLFRRA